MLRGHREHVWSNPIIWPSVSRKTLTVIPLFWNKQPTRHGRYDVFGRRSPSTEPQDDGGSSVRGPSVSQPPSRLLFHITRKLYLQCVLDFQAEERWRPLECAGEGGELGEWRHGSGSGLFPNDSGACSCKLVRHSSKNNARLRSSHLDKVLQFYADDIFFYI